MEARKLWVVSIALCWSGWLQVCFASDTGLTVEINAGATECFWQHFKGEHSAELEYQVIDGGDLDIDFTLFAPDGRVLQQDHRKMEDLVSMKMEEEGEYKFCFDNSFSRVSSKVVFFDLIVDDEEDADDNWDFDMEEVREMVDMTLDDIKGIIDRSKGHLHKSIQLQTLLKMHEARDRNIAEANYYRVNSFSAFQLFVMISVSLTQVLMIRSLFQDKSASRSGFKQHT